ncbi:hypothetical protein M3147_13370 [Agromyces mediolanus]|uniref:hypothetical protein n=1 Tax=Agromyces mediolanus TaxID=41986 RepID=UPI00203A4496|nr:hypothetical protein [Agromyces mediolanus]MCM3658238.1 hypothetical protein [Agromyces mediolanus]
MKRTAGKDLDGAEKYRRRRRYLRIGQGIMAVGFVVAAVHWLSHLEAFGPAQPEGWVDLVAGYPMGMLLVIAGAIVASRKPA